MAMQAESTSRTDERVEVLSERVDRLSTRMDKGFEKVDLDIRELRADLKESSGSLQREVRVFGGMLFVGIVLALFEGRL